MSAGELQHSIELVLTDFGLFVGKHSERVVVKKNGAILSEHPLVHLEQVLIASSGVTLSTDLIAECVQRGIPITFLDYAGHPYAKVVSPTLTATVKTRREQLMAYHDTRSVEVAKRFATGKLRNQVNLLRYFGKYRKQRQPEVFAELEQVSSQMQSLARELAAVEAPCIDEARATLLNLEGRAGALYWEGVKRLLPDGAFAGRAHRGATDSVNTLLNYGYGILYAQVWTALTLAGLEPFGGFLHVDRPGKPSLVLDFIEEFRQPIVDRTVIALLNKGFAVEWEQPDEAALKEQRQRLQPEEGESRRLAALTRKVFAAKVLERLEDEELFEGKRRKLKNILQMQARHLATFLRREGEYRPFVARW